MLCKFNTIPLTAQKIIPELKITYTIKNNRIELKNFDPARAGKLIRVYDNCLPVISFFHMKGNIGTTTQSVFEPSPGQGIILSVQVVDDNRRFEFTSAQNLSMNFSPLIVSVQMMLCGLAFSHTYEQAGLVNRFDVFIPANKINQLISVDMLEKLLKRKILNLEYAVKKSSHYEGALGKVLTELEKPNSKSLCTKIENFIQSLAMQDC